MMNAAAAAAPPISIIVTAALVTRSPTHAHGP